MCREASGRGSGVKGVCLCWSYSHGLIFGEAGPVIQHVGRLSFKQRLVRSRKPLRQSGTLSFTTRESIFILGNYKLSSWFTLKDEFTFQH